MNGERRVLVRGVELAVDRRGQGTDLVWGHGLTGSIVSEDTLGLVDWESVRRYATVLRYDARGHGESDGSPDPADLSWASLAGDQLALADAMGVGSYVAGGASMGCATALHAAVRRPDRIAGLLLVIPPTAWSTRAAQTSTYLAMADLVEQGDHDTLLRGAAATPSPDPFVGDPAWEQRFPDLLATADPTRLAAVFRGAATADLPAPDDIARLAVPTLILAWSGDPGHPVHTAARLQELLPHAELVVAATRPGLDSWTERIVSFLGQF